ncbi:Histidine kinase-, DNA gyrase B-, and HSP90-like ATPase [compost metagenome]
MATSKTGSMGTSKRTPVVERNDVDVTPPKRFFVEMLTRDIELEDAILDLLDNCVDGAVRVNASKRKPPAPERAYEGYWAEIALDEKRFSITDNCGGIPVDVAQDYAFKFGRPRNDIDNDLQTVGVYGIGMKRALFKLGQDSKVFSRSKSGEFLVHIDKAWIQNDKWNIHLRDSKAGVLDHDGVKIEVTDLHPGISSRFDRAASAFESNLIAKIRDHYAYIIQKGFSVKVNGTPVEPNLIQTLIGVKRKKDSPYLAPYLYETENDGVTIRLAMGMYAAFPTETELGEFAEGKRTKNSAGWTVICNDRVVLSHDVSHRTGWGEAGVPAYHSQFVMLSGIVEFAGNNAAKLPVTTTKRGINLDSPLYASVKDVMRDALKHFTTFTNQWKTDTSERVGLQKDVVAMDIRSVAEQIPATRWQEVRKNLKGRRFVPELPKPKLVRTHGRISFMRPLVDIESVREFLEMAENQPIGEVGAAAFDWVQEQTRA